MEVYIFRHGKTTYTTEHRYLGTTDLELSEEGVAEVERLRPNIKAPQVVFVSPLKRAKQTAAIWFPDAEQIEIDGLKEMDFGKFEGKTADEMKDDPEYKEWVDNFGRAACPEGEGMELFVPRVSIAFREVINQAKKKDVKDLVIVAHGVVIMAIMAGFCKDRRKPELWYSKTCEGWQTKLIGGQKKPVLIHPKRVNENIENQTNNGEFV